jgi:hypothetical protein
LVSPLFEKGFILRFEIQIYSHCPFLTMYCGPMS